MIKVQLLVCGMWADVRNFLSVEEAEEYVESRDTGIYRIDQ